MRVWQRRFQLSRHKDWAGGRTASQSGVAVGSDESLGGTEWGLVVSGVGDRLLYAGY
jgi:hypothetical protein